MKIFLDDYRDPQICLSYMHSRIGARNVVYKEGEWLIVRNYAEFVAAVRKYIKDITVVSFDHDLSDEHYGDDVQNFVTLEEYYNRTDRQQTGYDCAKWMLDLYVTIGIPLPEIIVHSMNPAGTKNIEDLFKCHSKN